MSISWKAWCELSSRNEILAPLSWCPSSGYFKNHWGLELFLKCHRGSQNVYFFYLGPIISLNIQMYFYWGSFFIARGNGIWFDFSRDAHFTSGDGFWMIFATEWFLPQCYWQCFPRSWSPTEALIQGFIPRYGIGRFSSLWSSDKVLFIVFTF